MTNEKDETLFVGKDVAKALGYAKPQNALATHVDKEDKNHCPDSGHWFEVHDLLSGRGEDDAPCPHTGAVLGSAWK